MDLQIINTPSIALYSLRGFFTEVDTLYLNINYKQLIKLEKNRSDKRKFKRDIFLMIMVQDILLISPGEMQI